MKTQTYLLNRNNVYYFRRWIPRNLRAILGKNEVVRSVLAEANGVRLIQASTQKLAGSELGRRITDGTVYLSCLMTIAQINKLQSSKVDFKHLQN